MYMKFTTEKGATYDVDLKARHCQCPDGKGFPFHEAIGIYVGSRYVAFKGEDKSRILEIEDQVVSVEDSPNDAVEAEPGNVLVLTRNSVYEINQEQKLVRKLSGLNPATRSLSPRGDWRQYEQLAGFAVGQIGLIYYPGEPNRPLVLTRIREIKGDLVETPQPGVLEVSVALVKQSSPSP